MANSDGQIVLKAFFLRHIIIGILLLAADKPTITIGIPLVRTVPEHIVWCSAEGTPPIQMSLLKGSTLFSNGTGMVWKNFLEEGTYTCVATNKVGSDSRDFPVTLTGLFNFVLIIFSTKCK